MYLVIPQLSGTSKGSTPWPSLQVQMTLLCMFCLVMNVWLAVVCVLLSMCKLTVNVVAPYSSTLGYGPVAAKIESRLSKLPGHRTLALPVGI